MLGSVLAFAALFTGPWGSLKAAALQIGSPGWFGYAGALLALNLLVLPGFFLLAVRITQKPDSLRAFKKTVTAFAQSLLPLGLCAWIAFTVSFAFPKANTILTVLSDPFGWGWDIFGFAGSTWTPDAAGFSPALQAGLLLLGLLWSSRVTQDISSSPGLQTKWKGLPVRIFCLVFTLAMLWLLIG
jgi:hypothetical protein